MVSPNKILNSILFRIETSIPNESRIPKMECPATKGFFLEGLSPSKVAKALSILSSMNVKLVKCHQNIIPSGNNRTIVMDKVYVG